MTLTLTVTINGEAKHEVSVTNKGATSPKESEDPDGERHYLVRQWRPEFKQRAVTHRRADGALVLAEKALAALNEPDEAVPAEASDPNASDHYVQILRSGRHIYDHPRHDHRFGCDLGAVEDRLRKLVAEYPPGGYRLVRDGDQFRLEPSDYMILTDEEEAADGR